MPLGRPLQHPPPGASALQLGSQAAGQPYRNVVIDMVSFATGGGFVTGVIASAYPVTICRHGEGRVPTMPAACARTGNRKSMLTGLPTTLPLRRRDCQRGTGGLQVRPHTDRTLHGCDGSRRWQPARVPTRLPLWIIQSRVPLATILRCHHPTAGTSACREACCCPPAHPSRRQCGCRLRLQISSARAARRA